MAQRLRYSTVCVAVVNGFNIERERVGAAVYWNAIRVEGDFVTAAYRNCGSKAKAIKIAESFRK